VTGLGPDCSVLLEYVITPTLLYNLCAVLVVPHSQMQSPDDFSLGFPFPVHPSGRSFVPCGHKSQKYRPENDD
jgi:hypothetical protein